MILDGQALFTQSFLYTSTGTNIEKLYRVFENQCTEVDTQLGLISLLNSVNDNSGEQLDALGQNLCLARDPGQTDEEYRVYLSIAIASQESSGTIPELVAIGKTISGAADESAFRPYELWRLTGEVYLDNTWPLDATLVMSPANKDPGNVEGRLEGNVDTMGVPLSVGDIISEVKAAGIGANFQIGFVILASKATLGTGDIDRLSTIKLYDGASELRSGTVTAKELSNGNWDYRITIPTTDMNTDVVNKIAAFDPTGTQILEYTFEDKPKNDSLEYQWIIIDDLI